MTPEELRAKVEALGGTCRGAHGEGEGVASAARWARRRLYLLGWGRALNHSTGIIRALPDEAKEQK